MSPKKGNKAKSSVDTVETEEHVAEPPSVVPVAAPVDEDDVEDPPVAGEGAAAKKKKKKNKKKAGDVDEEDAIPSAAVDDKPSGNADDDGCEDDDVEGGDAADAADKKKKRKKKKKAGAVMASAIPGGGVGVAKYCSDEEFEAWVKNTLEVTKNDSEGLSLEEQLKTPPEFGGFTYTGALRPAFVTQQRRMPEGIVPTDYANHPDGNSISEQQGPKEIPILEGEKLQAMREACRYGREVLDIAARFMRAGVTGDEIDRVVFQACVNRKIYPSPLNYYNFPKAVCVSPNEVICHGIPDRRPIKEGDIVNLDISIYHKGFHSDLNETFFIGQCDEEAQRVVQTAYNALYAAASQIKPGTFYRELGSFIHKEAVKHNCSVVTTYCGHGVGELFHGPPKVPHYNKNKAVGIMKPGHIFTVEPMINIGSNGGDKTWPDNWTAVTRDGNLSAQFEHTFLVTESGYEVLTGRPGYDNKLMPPYDPAMFQR